MIIKVTQIEFIKTIIGYVSNTINPIILVEQENQIDMVQARWYKKERWGGGVFDIMKFF